MTAPTKQQLAAALAANARLRGGTPDYAASMAAGHTETFAAFEARTARRDLSAVVGGASHRHDGQQLRAGSGAS
ncbi:hypothetical protein [Streptomyces sp. 184]|uniref:hypothetical protein n=1 Tax=Streptomyces sp. 184 TaxID=1827526 RepID=UPI00389208F0